MRQGSERKRKEKEFSRTSEDVGGDGVGAPGGGEAVPQRESENPEHIPVLRDTAIKLLAPKRTGVYVDGTIGAGGHARALLKHLGPKGHLIGIDCDLDTLKTQLPLRNETKTKISLIHANFGRIREAAADAGMAFVDGILLDLGMSSMQIDKPEKGFSYLHAGPLDMRMDPRETRTAADILNKAPETELADIFFHWGEDRFARRFARAIVTDRAKKPFKTTEDLRRLIERVHPRISSHEKLKSVSRIFQAMRIAVNHELKNLEKALEVSRSLLSKKGRLVVISYHSLEDRIVKHFLRGHKDEFEILTKKPIIPDPEEIDYNPRARSAKLRAAQRR